MKYTVGCLDGKNIDIDGVKVDCGELAKVWDMVRNSLWDQIEDGVRKRAEAEKEAETEKEDSADEVEEFTANDAHKLAHESAQNKINKDILSQCLDRIKEAASDGMFEIKLSVDGVAFNFVRYELVRLGYTVSSGEISEFDEHVMNFTVSW